MEIYVLIIAAIILTVFFSGMEIVFVTSGRLRSGSDRNGGTPGTGLTRFFALNSGRFIGAMHAGNTFSVILYALLMPVILSSLINPGDGSRITAHILYIIISAAILLFIAEFLPKTVFAFNSDLFLKRLSMPVLFFFTIFYPPAKLVLNVSDLVIRALCRLKKTDKTVEEAVFIKADPSYFLGRTGRSAQDNDEYHHNITIFRNVLDFSNIRIRECMIPRTEIEAVEITSSIDVLKEKFIETRLSRILVYKDTIDHIAGYFDQKDLFRNPPDIESGVRNLAIIPETMPASRLLSLFVEEKRNIALVVDEFGGTSGMVTIEDVLEEIVGDIEDEHDTSELVERKTGPGEFVFSGRLEIDYINENYILSLPESDEYETLAGMILYYNGSIPKNNDIIRIKNFVIKILRATPVRLDLVSLKAE